MNPVDLNRLLELRIRDLAAREPEGTLAERRERLLRSLGLYPEPPRTALNARVTGTIARDGYRIEKVRYESRPGLLVTAHLYLPDGDGRFPAILRPHGHWSGKKSEPLVQASAIGLALEGFAVLVVDSPGRSWDVNPQNERAGMGVHDDYFLAMGAPIQGVYTWDLMRGLDYLETRPDIDATRVGITGASGGAAATLYTFAVDTRIRAAVPVCGVASHEINPHQGCVCNHVPGVSLVGDRPDLLSMRSADGAVMIIGAAIDPEFPIEGHRRTYEKLRRKFTAANNAHCVRLEEFPHGHDYNRRMREAAVAFFKEHLNGDLPSAYVPERRPLTDGSLNPYPSGTFPFDAPEFEVVPEAERSTLTFRESLQMALKEPHPLPFVPDARLAPWGRYGRLLDLAPSPFLAIHDAGLEPREPNSIALPYAEIDWRTATYAGVSVAEFLAQLFHLSLPGAPTAWEMQGMSGDAITSLVASMRTLVGGAPVGPAPGLIIAQGPVASFVAVLLARYRPSMAIDASHTFTGWDAALELNEPAIAQPLARYLEFPAYSPPPLPA